MKVQKNSKKKDLNNFSLCLKETPDLFFLRLEESKKCNIFFSRLLFVILVSTEKFRYLVRQFRRLIISRAMKRASVNYTLKRASVRE